MTFVTLVVKNLKIILLDCLIEIFINNANQEWKLGLEIKDFSSRALRLHLATLAVRNILTAKVAKIYAKNAKIQQISTNQKNF